MPSTKKGVTSIDDENLFFAPPEDLARGGWYPDSSSSRFDQISDDLDDIRGDVHDLMKMLAEDGKKKKKKGSKGKKGHKKVNAKKKSPPHTTRKSRG